MNSTLPESVVSANELSLLKEIATTLTQATRVIITAHEKPDGDAIGAAMALEHALMNAGVDAIVAGLTPVPARYNMLPGLERTVAGNSIDPAPGDALVVLDAGELSRAEPTMSRWHKTHPVINIDHHLSNHLFGALNYVDSNASSTGELIYRLCTAADWTITPEIALCLWVALVTDTGRFAYDNTSAETLRVASQLRLLGTFRTAIVNEMLYENCSLLAFRLRERAAHSLELMADNRLAVVSLSQKDFAELNCAPEDAEEIVNIPRAIAGVDVAAFIYETASPHKVKLSLRTREPYDAASFCRRLGGGGHARAAGCSLDRPFADAQATFVREMCTEWFGS